MIVEVMTGQAVTPLGSIGATLHHGIITTPRDHA